MWRSIFVSRQSTLKSPPNPLKVPKSKIFDLFDFNDFYVMKCLWVGYLGAEIKNQFFSLGQIPIILSLLAYT
jgi:hypothetical protein